MSFSYSGDPGLTVLDQVRFLVGDTDEGQAQLQDEEIEYLLAQESTPRLAAALAAEGLAAKYASLVTTSIDGLSVSYSEKYRHYLDLAVRLRTGERIAVSPLVGGISVSQKQLVEEDEDRTTTTFRRDLHMDG